MRMRVLYIIIFILVHHLKAQESVLYQRGSNAISLRWKGIYNQNIQGYNVYRSTKEQPQTWVKLNPHVLYFVVDNSEISQIAGFKTASWLQLFGLGEKENLSPAKRSAIMVDSGGTALIGLMSLVNPEYARLMGEMYTDSMIQNNTSYYYRITAVSDDRSEKEIGRTPLIGAAITTVRPASDVSCNAGNQSVTLRWTNTQKDINSAAVVTQVIYRSDNLLGPFEKINYYGLLPFSSAPTKSDMVSGSYTESALGNGKTYYFKVLNTNAFGTESISNITVSGTPEDPSELAPPDNFRIVSAGNFVKFVFPEKGQYLIYRSANKKTGFTLIYPPSGAIRSFDSCYDRSAKSGVTYWYLIKRTNGEKEGPASDTVQFVLEDQTLPAMIGGIRVIPGNGFFKIIWNKSSENNLTGYEIERSSDEKGYTRFLLTSKPITQTVFYDTVSRYSTTRFGYIVYAVDRNNRRSAPSQTVFARMPDIVPPAAPYITELYQTDTQFILRWNSPPEKDIAGYRIYSKSPGNTLWEKPVSANGNEYRKKVVPGIREFSVTAFDSAGNEGPHSGIRTLELRDNFVVLPPVSGSILQTDSGSFLTWKWDPASIHKPDLWLVTINNNGKRKDIAELSFFNMQYLYKYPLTSGITFEIRAARADGSAGKPLILLPKP